MPVQRRVSTGMDVVDVAFNATVANPGSVYCKNE